MNRRIVSVTAAAVSVVLLVASFVTYAARRMATFHQESVIREIRAWGSEYSRISDDESAARSAEMIVYISTYYVPTDGKGSESEVERRLSEVRSGTMHRISSALAEFTGDDSVEDPLKWVDILNDADAVPSR